MGSGSEKNSFGSTTLIAGIKLVMGYEVSLERSSNESEVRLGRTEGMHCKPTSLILHKSISKIQS
jgi:hypothetical protein